MKQTLATKPPSARDENVSYEVPISVEDRIAEVIAQQQVKSSSYWFFWVAGMTALSIVRTFLPIPPIPIPLGLELVYLISVGTVSWGSNVHDAGQTIAALVTILIVLLGITAFRGRPWAFALGFTLYLLDSPLLTLFHFHGVSFITHVPVLFVLFGGWKASLRLEQLRASATTQAMRNGTAIPREGTWPPPPTASA